MFGWVTFVILGLDLCGFSADLEKYGVFNSDLFISGLGGVYYCSKGFFFTYSCSVQDICTSQSTCLTWFLRY